MGTWNGWLVLTSIVFSLSIFLSGTRHRQRRFKVKYDTLFDRFICDFVPHDAMKKGGTPPFFTFIFSIFLLSISSLA
jgi:hypothetical protein